MLISHLRKLELSSTRLHSGQTDSDGFTRFPISAALLQGLPLKDALRGRILAPRGTGGTGKQQPARNHVYVRP